VFYQAVTQASIYAVTDEVIWAGAESSANATSDQRSGRENGINLDFVNAATRDLTAVRVIAPITDVMSANADIPLPAQTDLAALITATNGLLTPAAFTTAQYTERKEKKNNPKTAF